MSLSLSAAALFLAQPAPIAGAELVLDARSPFIDATVAGKPVRLRVDVGAREMVDVNRSAVRRLGLLSFGRVLGALSEPDGQGGWTMRIGPARVSGEWSREQMVVADTAASVRVAWTEGDIFADADGAISPPLLPFDRVRIVQRAAGANDETVAIPVELGRGDRLRARLDVDGQRVDLEFEPDKPRTTATAAAGALLAQVRGGVLVGRSVRLGVFMGVARPMRELVLDRPLEVAGFRLQRLLVRWLDWAGRTTVPEEDVSSPNEILVSGRPERQRAWPKITLGADVLDRCAEITWERRPRRLLLTCEFRSISAAVP